MTGNLKRTLSNTNLSGSGVKSISTKFISGPRLFGSVLRGSPLRGADYDKKQADYVFSALFRVFTSWILCVQLGLGAVGVWIAMVADWICRVGFFVGRMRSGKWKTKYTPV